MQLIVHQSAQGLGVTAPAPPLRVRLQRASDTIQIVHKQVQANIGSERLTPDLHTKRVDRLAMQTGDLTGRKAHASIDQGNFGYFRVFAE
jgi:hypothetical protein